MLKFSNIWISLSLILYYFGPVTWPGAKEPWVAVFILSCLGMLNLGYRSLGSTDSVTYGFIVPLRRLLSKRIAYIIISTYGLLSIYATYTLTGLSIFSATTWNFDFGSAYSSYQLRVADATASGGAQLVMMAVKALLFPLTLILVCANFSRSRILVVLFFLPMIGSSFARGTDKETIDVMIILFTAGLYRNLNIKWLFYGCAVVLVVAVLFLERKIGRFDGNLPDCFPIVDICLNYDSFAASISPKLEFFIAFVTFYVTQGYEGLSTALSIPFEFNYGLGHMPPVASAVCRVTGALCDVPTHLVAIEAAGWETKFFWVSAYAYLASDISFYFVPLYMFLIGRIMACSENFWRHSRNPIALATLLLLAIFIVYSPANMQATISLDASVAWILLVYFPLLTMRQRLANH